MPAVDHPSQEMVECLKQIGELSDKHSIVEKEVASVMESQQEIAGELAKVEQTLPQKVSREDLNIPDDLQDQLAMLKQGTLANSWYEKGVVHYLIFRPQIHQSINQSFNNLYCAVSIKIFNCACLTLLQI